MFHRVRFEGKNAHFSFSVSSMELHSVFLWTAFRCHPSHHLPSLIRAFVTGGFVTGSTSVADTFCCPHAASQPKPVLLELCTPQARPFLSTQPRCAEELGLPTALKPFTNPRGRAEHGSSLHQLLLCVFREPHSLQGM